METRRRGRPVGSRNATRTTRTERNRRRVHNNNYAMRSVFVARRAPVEDEIPAFSVGEMSESCQFCNALHFRGEKGRDGFSQCCQKGKVVMSEQMQLKEVPALLRELYTGTDEESKNFQNNIRQYNSAFAFASQKVSLREFASTGPYSFCLHGTSYSRIGSIIPQPGNTPRFCQLYTLDTNEALLHRFQHPANQGCNPVTMLRLDEMLRENNPFASAFYTMGERLREERRKAIAENRELPDIRMVFARRDNDPRRYNLPTGDSVATIFVGENGEPPEHIDFAVHAKNGPLQTISNLSPRMDPMAYPLLFPNGEFGFSLNISHRNERATAQRNRLTMLQYYAYRIAVRPGFSALHSAGKLFQQYVCCSYVNQESNNLNWIRQNQPKLRTERYQGLMDYVEQEAQQRNVPPGRVIILPSSYKGSPRNMQQNYQDAMAIVRKYGKPDLFITFTCNPKWPEIVQNLKPWEKAEHRPDLTARVFNLKLKEMLNDLFVKNIFGQVVAHVYVIEFQKRGLPHAHLLLILQNEHKMREPNQIDEAVWAEIPYPNEYPRLYNSVMRHMIHGPCGTLNANSPCMSNGNCQKNFPKDFQEETVVCDNGYPKYKRRDTNITYDRNGKPVDNRWVVPYNPYLLLKYDAHINVEICTSIKSVKYLYKYIYKGYDSAAIEIHQRVPMENVDIEMAEGFNNQGNPQRYHFDEIRTYLDARYVGPPEAVWRLMSFSMDGMSHVIKQLAIHLEDQQNVVFVAGAEEAAVINNASKDTTLTAFFKLNCDANSGSQDYLYHEIPNHYVWERNAWKKRQRGGEVIIARMYQVSPKDTERYFLRLLLLHVRGPRSYSDLKTVNGTTYATFLEAAKARHLLHDEEEWSSCLEEACLTQNPKQLRFLFAIICVTAENLTNHLQLFLQYENHLSEDFIHRGERPCQCRYLTLKDIENTLRLNGKTCADYGLPLEREIVVNEDEIYDFEKENQEGARLYSQLNNEQKEIVDNIIASIQQNQPIAMFMDGPGGTGKTFVYKTLLHMVRGMRKIAIAVAPTGIAATLLPGGQTVHSRFKLPVPFNDTSVSILKPNSPQAEVLRKCSLIVWDEAPMSPNLHLKEVNRLLQEICSTTSLFGGNTVLLGGDFRQTLPVIPRANRSSIVNACMKRCNIWPQIEKSFLTTNMRAESSEQEFAAWLLKIGNGSISNEPDQIEGFLQLPAECLVQSNIEDEVFGVSISVTSV